MGVLRLREGKSRRVCLFEGAGVTEGLVLGR